MDRKLAWIGWLFLVGGLGFDGGAAYLAHRTSAFLDRAATTRGTVVELVPSTSTNSDGHRSTVYHPVVEYTPEGGAARRFRSGTGSAPPAFAVGEPVTVVYDPAGGDARIRATFELWGAAIILGGMGAVFALIGAGVILVRRAGQRRDEALRLHGRRVQARLQGVERNTSLRVNGQHPWRLACQWQDPATGLVHVFRSRNLWYDPTPYLHVEELTVFVDPRNPKRHCVDVDFLPRMAA